MSKERSQVIVGRGTQTTLSIQYNLPTNILLHPQWTLSPSFFPSLCLLCHRFVSSPPMSQDTPVVQGHPWPLNLSLVHQALSQCIKGYGGCHQDCPSLLLALRWRKGQWVIYQVYTETFLLIVNSVPHNEDSEKIGAKWKWAVRGKRTKREEGDRARKQNKTD